MTPLQRFRAYMARMNPVADPAQAIQQGLYVPPPGPTVAEQLARRLELEPASTHLILGGIGSGKTSELLQTKARLEGRLSEVGDHVEYIDVSRKHDLCVPELSGVLVALSGLSLAEPTEERHKPRGAHAVFLFDSLDRLSSPERFREAVEQDLRVLKAAGIGAAIVGPIRFMVGHDRVIGDLFDHTYFQLATDPNKPEGLAFLKAVLRRRADDDILPDECLAPLARAAGGALRDLINLAKLAGNEAYAAGHDPIAREDVDRAIDAFGRNLAVGLDAMQVATLKHLQHQGGFVVRGERELSLLETRRVLLYSGSRWVVHPALAPLLDAVPEAA